MCEDNKWVEQKKKNCREKTMQCRGIVLDTTDTTYIHILRKREKEINKQTNRKKEKERKKEELSCPPVGGVAQKDIQNGLKKQYHHITYKQSKTTSKNKGACKPKHNNINRTATTTKTIQAAAAVCGITGDHS